MTYIITNGKDFIRRVEGGNILWDDKHLQPVNTLTSKEMDLYGVVSISSTSPPTINPDLEYVVESDPTNINGIWTQTWEVRDLPKETVQANLKAKVYPLLDASDRTILRCVENNIKVPSEWVEYRKTLRTIIETGTGDVPEHPSYPEGT